MSIFNKPSNDLRRTWCNASQDDGMPCNAEIIKMQSKAYHDSLGFWWCEEHIERGMLLDWAMKHNFPMVEFPGDDGTRYAIGNGKHDADLWKAAVLLGQSKMIQAAIVALNINQAAGRSA
jgi:hypothetical protein